MTEVEYRLIPGFPAWYRVGDDGTVWSRFVKKQTWNPQKKRRFGQWYKLSPAPCRNTGYSRVGLVSLSSTKKTYRIYRLVLLAFVGTLPCGCQCRHLNGDRSDNRLCNLAYGTPKENAADKWRHGTHLYNQNSPVAKLTDSQAREIRQRVAAGERYIPLAAAYGVKVRTIGSVVRRENWKYLD